jgi:alkanesulfonate monooxygenase SsuD/methylene tetrahydromethanopterin reductase-like flavin-dependent oxidoreductase (luciferase family)
MRPQDPALDPLLALAWAAAHTATIRLATGIVILPQRNPVVLAKQVASLDVLSGGRVILGIGAGYLEPAFRAVGANFAGVDAHPRPLQQPIPLVVGGHSAPAYRRAVARAHGWYGYGLTPQQAAASAAGLATAADRVRRPAELGEPEISVTPRGQITRELAAEFAQAGVHRLVLLAPPAPDGPAQTIQAGTSAISGL